MVLYYPFIRTHQDIEGQQHELLEGYKIFFLWKEFWIHRPISKYIIHSQIVKYAPNEFSDL